MHWPVLDGLPDEEVRRLLEVGRRRRFATNEVVFHQDDPADTIHLISSGRFAVRVSTAFANSAVLDVLGPGNCFGELALLSPGSPRSASLIALEQAQTISIHEIDFSRVRRQYPQMAEALISVLAAQVRRLSEQVLDALYLPAEHRVRKQLAHAAALYGPAGEGERVIPLTQEEIAGLAGTSRATVNRVLREEQRRGTVQLSRGQTIVRDVERLAGSL